MDEFRKFVRGKRVTLMGLGLLGRGVGDAEFLASCGAKVVVTDLKDKKTLAPSLSRLKNFKNISFVLGAHRLKDFRSADFVLKAAGVPFDSPFINEAKKHNIPVLMDASLFARFAPATIVGVTGTRGKSTTTHCIYHTLARALRRRSGRQKRQAFLGGNVKGVATLPLLRKVKKGDIVVLELDSWQLQGFGEAHISPRVAVFTNFLPDHMNYYGGSMVRYFADKANIFKYQKKGDVLVAGISVAPLIRRRFKRLPGELVVTRERDVPASWRRNIPGEHNRANIACAIAALRALKISEKDIQRGVEIFKGVPGRLELLRTVRGVQIYNDNNATTPEATIAALRAVGNSKNRRVVLIMGGDDKHLDMSALIEEIPQWCSKVVLFKERGTDRIRDEIFSLRNQGLVVYEERGLSATVRRAFALAERGETILYSPAFSSFGKWFKNEYDRGDQFVRLVKKLR